MRKGVKNIQGKTKTKMKTKTTIFLDDERIIHKLTNNLQKYKYIKNQLKKHNLQNYYEFIPIILKNLNIEVVDFTEQEESILSELFVKVSLIHDMLYLGESFLPYNYVLYQLAKYIDYKKLHLLELTRYNKSIYDKKWGKIHKKLIEFSVL